MLRKKKQYIQFNKRFKDLEKIKNSSLDLYFKLISLFNDCKEFNISFDYLFLQNIVSNLKKINDNCSARVFDVFYSYEKHDGVNFNELIKTNKTYNTKFNKTILELKQNNVYLSIKQVKNLFNNTKIVLKLSKDKLNNIYNELNKYELNLPEERFFWSRSLESENLNLILLGSNIYCYKFKDKWMIYDADKVIFDNLNKNLNIFDLEDKIIDFFTKNNIDYKHLLLDYNDTTE